MNEDELASLVLAPKGWEVDKGSIPEGYMMHIMSAPWPLHEVPCPLMWFHGISWHSPCISAGMGCLRAFEMVGNGTASIEM